MEADYEGYDHDRLTENTGSIYNDSCDASTFSVSAL